MKAKIINERIVEGLPKYYKHWAGGFDEQSTEIHEQEGFFDVITPTEIDKDVQTLGDIYFDEINRVFTYPVIDLDIDLEDEKIQRKADLKLAVEGELITALSVGVLEKIVYGDPIPQEYIDILTNLRAWEAQTYIDIDAFTDPKLMRKYKIKQEDIESAKTLLKAGRKS